MHAAHENITGAADIGTVMNEFKSYIDRMVKPGGNGVLVAFNGASCDLRWLWRLTQAPNSHHRLSERLRYFFDPFKVIPRFEGCKLNKNHSKLESYELGVVWKFINWAESQRRAR